MDKQCLSCLLNCRRYFLIGDPATDAFHYAIFEEVKLVSEVEDQEKTGAPYIISSKTKAIAIAKIIGYQDQRIKEKLSFRRGIGHYPKFNSKCYLLTSQEKKIYLHWKVKG